MAHTTMPGAEIILKALADQGVEVIFGYPGGAILPIYDAIYKQNKIRHILVRHEQAAVHAAEGYARSTGKVGVVLVTSGPGATNAVTGLADAMMDSIPLVCLTGQVPTHLIGNDAFQEADITGITRPCTKHNYLVKDVENLGKTLHEAFYIARSGRPGPVLVDLPKDVLINEGHYQDQSSIKHKTYVPQTKGDAAKIDEALDMILAAKKPIFYAGGGVINSGEKACTLLTQLVQATGAPVTLTLMGLGAYPASDKQFLGMLGMHGTYEANMAMHESDLIVAIGARFDDRITGRLDAFAPHAKKIHIDIDPSSINKSVVVDTPIVGDVASVLEDMLAGWETRKSRHSADALKAWWARIAQWRTRDCLRYDQSSPLIKPQKAIERLYEMTRDREIFITTEVGQHQMWAAQFFKFDKPYHWMTSGGLGTMGYGLPSSMGVQLAHPDALVVGISGESSFQMNVQELATLAQYRIPVKIFVLNNQYMGMVRQWQELLYDSRYSESHMDFHPDLVKLADAYGLRGLRIDTLDQLDDGIREMINHPGTVLVDCRVDPSENCFPMIPPGAAHNDMLMGPEDERKSKKGAGSEEGMVLV